MKRKYPRSAFRKLIRNQTQGVRVAGNVDILVYLDLLLFLKHLAQETGIAARQSHSKIVQARHVQQVLPRILKQFKG